MIHENTNDSGGSGRMAAVVMGSTWYRTHTL